jgi:hypothetical protein
MINVVGNVLWPHNRGMAAHSAGELPPLVEAHHCEVLKLPRTSARTVLVLTVACCSLHVQAACIQQSHDKSHLIERHRWLCTSSAPATGRYEGQWLTWGQRGQPSEPRAGAGCAVGAADSRCHRRRSRSSWRGRRSAALRAPPAAGHGWQHTTHGEPGPPSKPGACRAPLPGHPRRAPRVLSPEPRRGEGSRGRDSILR